jgi:hypothetical protein
MRRCLQVVGLSACAAIRNCARLRPKRTNGTLSKATIRGMFHTKTIATLLVASTLLIVTGVLVGALSLSGAEPEGIYVDCGPALFGLPSPLPDPACSSAYTPLPQLSIALIIVGIAGAIVLAFAWNRSSSREVATP